MIDNIINLYTERQEIVLAKLLEEFKEDLIVYFSEQPISLIFKDFRQITNSTLYSTLTEDPSGLLQITLLTYAIYIKLCETNDSERILILRNAFRDSIVRQISNVVEKSEHQLSKLFGFLNKLADKCLTSSRNKIYILELPVGNSIPSTLLQTILAKKGLQAELITISINRNDSRQQGITRKELIVNNLEGLDLESSVLLYVDEWITGSNFNNIITILSKIPKLNFWPCGILTSESSQEEKYLQYKSKHNEICKKIGFDGDELSITLPVLNITTVSEQKFIWTESDRLAGYRKLEFWGSIISSFLAASELLFEDSQKLDTILSDAVSKHTFLTPGIDLLSGIRQEIQDSLLYFNSMFYDELKKNIKTVKPTESIEFNLDDETDRVFELFKSTKGYDNAKLAINIIGHYLKNNVINPTSRYFYKGYAPLCLPLKGDEKILNTLFLEKVIQKYMTVNS